VARQRAFGEGFAAFFRDRQLATIVAPTNAPAWTIDLIDGDRRLGGSSFAAAVSGFPLVTVPSGFAFDALPLGLTFMGPPHSEARLLPLAYAFEHAQPVRRPPRFLPTLELP
jgi:amidase